MCACVRVCGWVRQVVSSSSVKLFLGEHVEGLYVVRQNVFYARCLNMVYTLSRVEDMYLPTMYLGSNCHVDDNALGSPRSG